MAMNSGRTSASQARFPVAPAIPQAHALPPASQALRAFRRDPGRDLGLPVQGPVAIRALNRNGAFTATAAVSPANGVFFSETPILGNP